MRVFLQSSSYSWEIFEYHSPPSPLSRVFMIRKQYMYLMSYMISFKNLHFFPPRKFLVRSIFLKIMCTSISAALSGDHSIYHLTVEGKLKHSEIQEHIKKRQLLLQNKLHFKGEGRKGTLSGRLLAFTSKPASSLSVQKLYFLFSWTRWFFQK